MENHKQNHSHQHSHKSNGSHPQKLHQDALAEGGDEAIDLESLGAAPSQQPPKPAEKAASVPIANDKAAEKEAAANAEVEKRKAQIDELKLKIEAGNDKYLRLMAEFDNFKRRTAKEYQQLIEQANEKLMKDFIEVRENFERAFKHHKEGSDPKSFIDGMRMIFTKLDAVLHKNGLEIYSEAGQKFDPEIHDAMMKVAHEHIPEEHIAEVCERGYKLKGKVIKHSRVIVSSGKPAEGAAPATQSANACKASDEEAVIEVASKPEEQSKPEAAN